MTRLLAGGFLLAHGFVHAAIWLPPQRDDAPIHPGRSWLLGEVRPAAMVLAALAAAAFVAAGVGCLGSAQWWATAGVAGAAVSILLLVLTFTPW